MCRPFDEAIQCGDEPHHDAQYGEIAVMVKMHKGGHVDFPW
jgi:hypothetical protein